MTSSILSPDCQSIFLHSLFFCTLLIHSSVFYISSVLYSSVLIVFFSPHYFLFGDVLTKFFCSSKLVSTFLWLSPWTLYLLNCLCLFSSFLRFCLVLLFGRYSFVSFCLTHCVIYLFTFSVYSVYQLCLSLERVVLWWRCPLGPRGTIRLVTWARCSSERTARWADGPKWLRLHWWVKLTLRPTGCEAWLWLLQAD